MRWPLTLYRTILTWTLGVAATIVGAVAVMVIVAIDKNSPWIERVIHTWSRIWLWASGTTLTIEGQENIDPEQSYVVVANHLSTLDIMVCFLAVPLPIRYLAKKELFRIPLLAQGMRSVGIIEVDRAARTSIHSSVNKQAKDLIANRRSLIIYAEGTRPRNGVMKPFKKGAFTMAIDAQLPVLPVSIHGTYEAAAPGKPWFHGGPVTAIVDPPISTEGMKRSDTDALRDRVRDLIAKRVADLGGPVG